MKINKIGFYMKSFFVLTLFKYSAILKIVSYSCIIY
jgi:hypothetical protein